MPLKTRREGAGFFIRRNGDLALNTLDWDPSMITPEIDYKTEGEAVTLELLRGVALGGKRSQELEFLVASQISGDRPDYQALALTVANESVPEESAKATYRRLLTHQ